MLDNLSLVAFIQDNDTRRVLDAVHLPLTELYPLGGKEITASNNFSLQISPNPFKNKTAIRVRLSEPGDFTAIICDLTGKNEKTLCQQKLASGIHQFFWDGTDDAGAMMPAGIYICRIIAGNSFSSEKLILIR